MLSYLSNFVRRFGPLDQAGIDKFAKFRQNHKNLDSFQNFGHFLTNLHNIR